MHVSTPTVILDGDEIVSVSQPFGDNGEVFSLHVTGTEDHVTTLVIMGTAAQVTQFTEQLLAAVRA